MTDLWQHAQACLAQDDLSGALDALDALLSEVPADAEALALAGWLRTTSRPAEHARGLEQLTLVTRTDAPPPLAIRHLAQALVAAGSASEAVSRLDEFTTRFPRDRQAFRVRGWLLGVVGSDAEGALASLAQAGDDGDVLFERGRVLLKARRPAGAGAALAQALRQGGLEAPAGCWRALGECYTAQGQLRRALGAFRRAMELDARGEGSFQLHTLISTLTQVLHQQRRYFLHPHEDSQRSRALGAAGSTAPSWSALVTEAHALEAAVRSQALSTLRLMARIAEQGSLGPELADQSPALELEQTGGASVHAFAARFRAAQLATYEALLQREEPSQFFEQQRPSASGV